MDIASIPVLCPVVLMGLDFSMRPTNVRYEIRKGFIRAFPELMVMHKIKTLALMVYHQEKSTPLYHHDVCQDRKPLAYFICAMHRQSAPQQKKEKVDHTLTSSSATTDSNSPCKSVVPGKTCELPQLATCSMLPLGYWDSLYYAVVAEILRLHTDLRDRFGPDIEHGTLPLHYCGVDDRHNDPITPRDQAALLESAWCQLMDSRLVAGLDEAVGLRKIGEDAHKMHAGTNSKRTSDDDGDNKSSFTHALDVEGIVDIMAMTVEEMIDMLWTKHAPETNQACSENFEDSSMLAMLEADFLALATRRDREYRAFEADCRCRAKCVCSLMCDIHAGRCTCMTRLPEYHEGTKRDDKKDEHGSEHNKREEKDANPGDGAAAARRAEQQLERPQRGQQTTVNDAQEMVEKYKVAREMPSRYRNRDRKNTNRSDLAYVHDANPSRGQCKDVYPLGFYTEGSPQRYPKIRNHPLTVFHNEESMAALAGIRQIPARKPVPAALLPAQPYVAPGSGLGVITPPSDSRYNASAFAVSTGQAAYQKNEDLYQAMKEKQTIVTQSLPAISRDTRQAINNDPFVDNKVMKDPASEYVDLLSRHPSSVEQPTTPQEPSATLNRFKTTTPSRQGLPSKTIVNATHLPTPKSVPTKAEEPPLPPLPAFIAPPPVLTQRFVSAGGNTPLHERAEIAGPAFNVTGYNTPLAHASGAGISKAELDAKMSDSEWVKTHFGAVAGATTPPQLARGSSEEAAAAAVQRDRTSSGLSATFKRVFSRRHSNDLD